MPVYVVQWTDWLVIETREENVLMDYFNLFKCRYPRRYDIFKNVTNDSICMHNWFLLKQINLNFLDVKILNFSIILFHHRFPKQTHNV